MARQGKPAILFVPGLWAGGASFAKLIPALQADGHDVIVACCGLTSLADDVAAVKGALDQVDGPAILVGHCFGGTLITAAGTDPRVAGLVYIAALAPDRYETSQSLQDEFPATELHSCLNAAEGRVWLKPEGIPCLAGDLTEPEQKLLWATQAAPALDLLHQKVEGTAWWHKPSWYVIATEDRALQPDLQRFLAVRMAASIAEIATSHLPMLSHPALVLDVIRQSAAAVRCE